MKIPVIILLISLSNSYALSQKYLFNDSAIIINGVDIGLPSDSAKVNNYIFKNFIENVMHPKKRVRFNSGVLPIKVNDFISVYWNETDDKISRILVSQIRFNFTPTNDSSNIYLYNLTINKNKSYINFIHDNNFKNYINADFLPGENDSKYIFFKNMGTRKISGLIVFESNQDTAKIKRLEVNFLSQYWH